MPKVKAFDRKQVLADLVNLFRQKGYNGTSIQDIADLSNLSRSSIYDTFKSKDRLFQEVLQTYVGGFGKQVSKVVKEADDAYNAIKGIFELSIDEVVKKDKKNSGCLYVNTKAELWREQQIVGNALSHAENGLFELFEKLVIEGQTQGHINTCGEARELALYLITALHGFRITGISNQNRAELRSLMNVILTPLKTS